MKKIGFIDLSIDEFHANNYPKWIKESSLGHAFDVALAWEETPKEGLRNLAQWCRDLQITPASSLEQVVEVCDAICVLAPSNPEVHERLADLALQSGKPVYIDKPFAPDRAAAERLFALADQHGTPVMSSSALRYGTELQQALRETMAGGSALFVNTAGGGASFWEYAIHQVEMITTLLGTGARRVLQCGNGLAQHMVIAYPDERRAAMSLIPGQDFQVSAANREHTVILNQQTGFFTNLIDAILNFFATGKSPIDRRETIEIAAIVATGIKALETPGVWIDID